MDAQDRGNFITTGLFNHNPRNCWLYMYMRIWIWIWKCASPWLWRFQAFWIVSKTNFKFSWTSKKRIVKIFWPTVIINNDLWILTKLYRMSCRYYNSKKMELDRLHFPKSNWRYIQSYHELEPAKCSKNKSLKRISLIARIAM